MGLFKRHRRQTADTSGLGRAVVALKLDDGDSAPAGSVVVIFNASGHARHTHAGRVTREDGETVWCFHPGPYRIDLTPFAAAPELGLRLQFVIDAADPRVSQQRFDLYLHSEAETPLAVGGFGAAIEAALQTELAQGSIYLPPCTAIDEWHEFRAGLNQLLYTRFGVTVEDCVPVDLGDRVDYAQMLAERAAQLSAVPAIVDRAAHEISMAASSGDAALTKSAPVGTASESVAHVKTTAASQTAAAAAAAAARTVAALDVSPSPPASPQPSPAVIVATAADDARSLRRLFLEVPALTTGWRLITLPAGQVLFQSHQQLLRRLGLIGVGVSTMPSLAWAAPDQPLEPQQQARRAASSIAAAHALNEAWALLARLQLAAPAQLPELFDEADRILSNLEHHLQSRRQPFLAQEAQESEDATNALPSMPASAQPAAHRKEPSL